MRAMRDQADRRARGESRLAGLVCACLLGAALFSAATPSAAQQRIDPPPQPESVEAQPLENDLGANPALETAPAPGSRQQADREWGELKRSAGEIWETAVATVGPYLATPNASIALVALAAAFGGYVGARLRRGGRGADALPTVPSAPRSALPPPPRDGERRLGRAGGREPRLEGPRFEGPRFEEPRAAAPTLAGPGFASEPAAPPAPPPAPDPEARRRSEEAERIFAFFAERFGPTTATAEGAIDYLTRLGGSVEGLRKRLADRDAEIERLKLQPAPAPAAAQPAADPGEEAPWSTLIDGGRMIRAASQALQSDTDFQDLSRETRLADAMRNIAALRADRDDGRRGISAAAIEEAWPHVLFRAEALAAAYYPTTMAWRDLRLGLNASASALRQLLRRENLFVDYVLLLNPIESAEAEPWSDAGGLRNLGPVRRTLAANAGAGSEDLVIDCESFGYFDKTRDRTVRSKVILFNRTEWR